MITPITRKELYLAKIIGEDVDVPETAKTREELFFLKILDNSSKIPEPITREELFLAKIAGQDVELPEPKTRLELFLAKAAGVEIETPEPITREEVFWSNYSAIVDFEVESVPPLTYKAVAGALKDYRIYGNTANGEPVGDVVTEGEHTGEYVVPVTVSNGTDTLTTPIYLPEQIKKVGDYSDYIDYGSQKFVHRVVRKVFDGTEELHVSIAANIIEYIVPVITMRSSGNSINCTSNHISAVSGSENWAKRRVPNAQYVSSIFYNNASQIRFVWNDNNGIVQLSDLTAQLSSWYANGDPLIVDYIIETPVEEQVTLPTLPTLPGTNVLSVGTAVQPSKVYIKGQKGRD